MVVYINIIFHVIFLAYNNFFFKYMYLVKLFEQKFQQFHFSFFTLECAKARNIEKVFIVIK